MTAILALLAQIASFPGAVQAPAYPLDTTQPGLNTRAPFINVKAAPFFCAGNGVADDTACLQAALDRCDVAPQGCRVYVPSGQYKISTALHPPIGTTIDCAASDVAGLAEVGGTTGTMFITTGAIWAFENFQPTVRLLNNVTVNNCVFELSTNASALGAINLRGVSWSKFHNVSIILPASGVMEGVRFDAQDIGSFGIGGYWNELYGVNINANGTTNTHKCVRWINGANSNHVVGGNFTKCATAYSLEGGNGNIVWGGGSDTYTVGCIVLGNSSTVIKNTFVGNRCENATGGGVAVTIGAAAYGNMILNPFITGAASAAQVITDNSAGLNTVEAYDTGANAHVYTIGGRFQDVWMGLNRSGRFNGLDVFGMSRASGAIAGGRFVVTYSASMTFDVQQGNEFQITATNGTAFTINNPTNSINLADGQRITVRIMNTSGGALGAITWGTWFKLAAWVSPATGFGRTIDFTWDNTAGFWREVSRSAADVAN